MLAFLARRLGIALGVLIASSYVFYMLAAYAGDPLEDLRTSQQSNREQLIEQRTELLNLDTTPALRYFSWAAGASKCLILRCDLGVSFRSGDDVQEMLGSAVWSTIQLIGFASILAIVVGAAIGIVSALRQYTGFDYGVTLASFLMYSLPSFFVAVLLKQWGAIGFNDFLQEPTLSPTVLFWAGVIAAIIVGAALGGRWLRRLGVGAVAGAITVVVLWVLSSTGWFEDPRLGPWVVGALGVGVALLVTFLVAGLRNRPALTTAMSLAVLTVVAWFPLQQLFRFATVWLVLAVAVAMVAVGLAVGAIVGGPDRGVTMRVGAIASLPLFGLLYLDHFLSWWQRYTNSGAIGGRPIATVGSSTPQLAGSGFWVQQVDAFTHMILPITAIVLISLAGYTRYARGSMLEVLNLDYIRTARAKGLPERTVVMRHAFRNSLIPLATIIPLDIAALVGGAVITETIFGWTGMGRLFVDALRTADLNPLMGYFLVTGAILLIGNIIADIMYAALDPRIRVDA